jgi:DNA-binding protein H-NS
LREVNSRSFQGNMEIKSDSAEIAAASENSSMSNLETLLSQRAELEAKIAAAQTAERADAIATVRKLIAMHGLSMADVTAAPGRKPGRKPAGKATGARRGRPPKAAVVDMKAAFAAKPGRSGKGKGKAKAAKSLAGIKIPPKYRDSEGNTWTGRGLKPKWLSAAMAKGAKLEQFAI